MDGASTNLAMIKLLSGNGKGAYGIDDKNEDPFRVWPKFPNPIHDTDIHLIICPTHQVPVVLVLLHIHRMYIK